MAGSRSLQNLLTGPVRTNTLQYEPQTGQQYTPGQIMPGGFADLLSPTGSSGLQPGWAPRIGHIKLSSPTAKRRTNPFLTGSTVETTKKKNPFLLPAFTPSPDLFGLNIPS